MKCPECKKGIIKVLYIVACECCGHRRMFCNECFIFFSAECGLPRGREKLPPEFPMFKDDRLTKGFSIMNRDSLEEMATSCPTLEEYKDMIKKLNTN